MTKIKKFLIACFALLLTVGATACSNSSKKSSSNSNTPKSLNVQFVPSVAANKLEARAKPMEKMLSKRLGIPVHVSMSTNYNGLVEAMKSKKVDVGFLPSDAYIMAHKQGAADLLLQAERYRVTQPKQKGLDVTKKCKLVTVTGADQAVLNVLNGDTDAAFVYEDARNDVLKDEPKIMSKVVPIYFTKRIPNDTISVLPSMSKSFRKKLAKAFISIANSKAGKKMIENIYSHEGYTYAKDSDYNIIRKYDKLIASTKK